MRTDTLPRLALRHTADVYALADTGLVELPEPVLAAREAFVRLEAALVGLARPYPSPNEARANVRAYLLDAKDPPAWTSAPRSARQSMPKPTTSSMTAS